MKLIDVSVPLDAQLPTYPAQHPVYAGADQADCARRQLQRLDAAHERPAGTHVDAPRHFFDDGPGTEALPLELLIGRTRVIEVSLARRHRRRGSRRHRPLGRHPRADQDAQLAVVGLARVPHRTTSASPSRAPKHLVEHGIKVVGVDYLSVEQFKKPGAPAHHVLLGAGTIVIEGLDLRDVDPGIYEMFCLPLRIVGSDGAPARVVLRKS